MLLMLLYFIMANLMLGIQGRITYTIYDIYIYVHVCMYMYYTYAMLS